MPESSPFSTSLADSVYRTKYAKPGEEWTDTAMRIADNVVGALPGHSPAQLTEFKDRVFARVDRRELIPGGRMLYATGNDFHQTQNCLLLRAEDTREGWSDLSWKAEMALLTGAGIGAYYGALREEGALIRRTGGVASGPVPKMVQINETGRGAVQGGNRRSAIWAGLPWWHPDIDAFMRVKDWPQWLRDAKDRESDPDDHEVPFGSVHAPCDMTNISVCLDDEFFAAIGDPRHPRHEQADRVYRKAVDKMVTTGEPGFSIDLGDHANEQLRNACTEIVSEDDSDVCNLGGLVLSRFDDPRAFENAVRDGVLLLTANTCYSDLPYEQVGETREKNRRLGLDLIGVHEFLLQRGLAYGSDDSFEALEPYFDAYARALDHAHEIQDAAGLSRSVAATSGAPTGTRGIIAESTTGHEPVTAAAFKRIVRHSHGTTETREVHYVIDPTVKRLVDEGVLAPDEPVEDSFSLAQDPERRFRHQAFAQKYTDQAISMTINLEAPIVDPGKQHEFGDLLLGYLPQLRGITCYPNNARAGQPITPVPLAEALDREGVTVWEDEEKCASGVCGI